MQLLLLLFLLLGGKTANLNEVKPLLESFGGEEVKSALKEAERIQSVISAVQTAATAFGGAQNANAQGENVNCSDDNTAEGKTEGEVNFPLAPIAEIADEGITYSLSKFIATGN